MILIFDTYGGLCNQMYDIYTGIQFCIENNLQFSFRFCSFRNPNLSSWYNKDFATLFDTGFLDKYTKLYVKYNTLQLTSKNTYSIDKSNATDLFSSNSLHEMEKLNTQYIVIKQCCAILKCKTGGNIYRDLLPSPRLMAVYNKLRDTINHNKKQYNFIHYRYEHDFTNHFRCTVPSFKDIIRNLKDKFKNPQLKIYVATTNIKRILEDLDKDTRNILLYKNEDELTQYNFEENAFIDYMFGLHAAEIYGHSKSSFSHMLNNLHNTHNFYI